MTSSLARIIAAIVLGVLVIFVASVCYERWRGTTTAQQDTARAHTQAAELIAAKAETVFVERQAAATAARIVYRTARDTVLRHLTDTLLVKQTIAHADTVIARDSVAIEAAIRTVIAERGVTDSVRKELALALKPHYAPRLSASAAALYDPVAQVPAASLTGSLRLVGSVSLIVRGDQRFTPGEKPRGYVGASINF